MCQKTTPHLISFVGSNAEIILANSGHPRISCQTPRVLRSVIAKLYERLIQQVATFMSFGSKGFHRKFREKVVDVLFVDVDALEAGLPQPVRTEHTANTVFAHLDHVSVNAVPQRWVIAKKK